MQLEPPPQIESFNYIWRKWLNGLYAKVTGLPVQTSGPFTPAISGGTVAGVGTYSAQAGYYVKTGTHVHGQMFLNWSTHTGTGALTITGIPFANANITNIYASAVIGEAENIALTAGNIMVATMSPGSSVISIRQHPVGGGAASNVPMDTAGYIIISIDYVTT